MQEVESNSLQQDCSVVDAVLFLESNQQRLDCLQTFDAVKRDPERTRFLELRRRHQSPADPLLTPLFTELDHIVEQLEIEEQANAALIETLATLKTEVRPRTLRCQL